MTIDAVQAVLIRNLTRLDAVGKYAESLKEKLAELMEEHTKEAGADTPSDCVPFHIGCMNIIIDDILRLVDGALEDVSNPTVEPKAKKK